MSYCMRTFRPCFSSGTSDKQKSLGLSRTWLYPVIMTSDAQLIHTAGLDSLVRGHGPPPSSSAACSCGDQDSRASRSLTVSCAQPTMSSRVRLRADAVLDKHAGHPDFCAPHGPRHGAMCAQPNPPAEPAFSTPSLDSIVCMSSMTPMDASTHTCRPSLQAPLLASQSAHHHAQADSS